MTSVLSKKQDSGSYSFQSKPRTVQRHTNYHCYDEPENQPYYANIMYDRRVIRGNTYALHKFPIDAQPDPVEIQRRQEARRRALLKRRSHERFMSASTEPVEGRKHVFVQTQLYLEELSDRIEEADVDTQTDAFLDRPPTPLYFPAKTGKDVATQILEGDLFDFDLEVKPILEILVGKTLEQALIEVLEEEELANLRKQQREFEELRNAEIVETQRLEEKERRHREEKERRKKQQREILAREKEVADKIAARAFAQNYLIDLIPSVFHTLRHQGYFYDPVERDVEENFAPFLVKEAIKKVDKKILGRLVLDSLLRDVVTTRLDRYNPSYRTGRALRPRTSKRPSKKVSLMLEPQTSTDQLEPEIDLPAAKEIATDDPVTIESVTDQRADQSDPDLPEADSTTID